LKRWSCPRRSARRSDSALRQIEFLDREIEAVERLIATEALESAEIRWPITVPGVNVIWRHLPRRDRRHRPL